jgi:hypothetical protein
VSELQLEGCAVDVSVVAAVPGIRSLTLVLCELPEQWVLPALAALSTLTVEHCTGLTSLDTSAATALTSLDLNTVESLKWVGLPVGLKKLDCRHLLELADLNLSAAPDVEAYVYGCPAINLRYHKLTLVS